MHGSRIRLHPHQGPPTHSAPSIRTTDSIASADPVSKGQTCYALGVDSSRCYLRVQEHYHKYCPRHNKELRKSTDEYKTKEREAKNIEKEGQYRESEQQVQNLISIKEDIVKLRGQVQFRFFSRAADNLGHSQRILKLQDEIRSLVAERQSLQENRGLKSSTDPHVHPTENPRIDPTEHAPTKSSSSPASAKPTPEDKHEKLVYRSLLSQQVPAEELNGLESDHPVHILKTFIAEMAHGLVDKLLGIVPALDDGIDPQTTDGSGSTSEQVLDTIVRNWFRRLVLARGQPDVLNLASRHTSIIGFLRSGVEPEELRKYIEYFENVDVDALRHLRCAVSDSSLKDTQNTISILGGSVSTDDDFEELSTDMWDMVFGAFENLIPWYLLPCLYMNIADNLHMNKLLLLNRYGEEWAPEESPVRDTIGPLLGFVVSTQGFCDPPLPNIVTEERGVRATEHRNYLAIRMSPLNSLTEALLVELKRRTRNYLVVAWKGAGFESPVFRSEEDIFIRRTRTARTEADLKEAPWEVFWDLNHVITDLRTQRYLFQETHEDFMQILVIDRAPGLPFSLMHSIEDILMELSGDPSTEEILQKTISNIIPQDERTDYLKAAVAALKSKTPQPTAYLNQVSYEGNRSRCWDATRIVPSLLESPSGTHISVEHSRFISAICNDMESKGTIRIMEKYVAPQGMARALLGSDGKLDLYIDYRRLLASMKQDAMSSRFDLPPAESLLNFASDFDDRNATAIYTKGSIATKYCAWPMDAVGPSSIGLPNFTTPAGHLYQWVKFPFDFPLIAQFWQSRLSNHFEECATFARFYLTTFVVCAVDQTDAQEKMRQLYEVAQRHGLRLCIPSLSMWAGDYRRIGLDKIYNGVKPAGHE